MSSEHGKPVTTRGLAVVGGRWRLCMQVALIACVGTGLFGLRVWSRKGAIQTTDGQAYERMAEGLLAGEGYTDVYWCPGYSAFFTVAKLLFGSWYQYAMLVIQYGIVLGCGWLLLRVIQRHVNHRLGALAFAFFVLSPHLINHASKLRPEVLCMGFAASGIFTVLDGSLRTRSLCFAALWLALSSHVRNTSLGIGAATALWLMLLSSRGWTRRAWCVRLRRAAVFSAVFAALILPWCTYASLRAGKPVLIASNAGRSSRLGAQVTVYTLSQTQRLTQEPNRNLRLLDRSWMGFQSLWVQWVPLPVPEWQSATRWMLLQGPMFLLTPGFLLAMTALISQRNGASAIGFCVSTAALYTVALACIYVRVRYRYPVDPAIYFAGVAGWDVAAKRQRWRLWPRTPAKGQERRKPMEEADNG